MSTPFARLPLIDSRFRCGTCHLPHCNASIRILVNPSERPTPSSPLISPSSSVYRPLMAATKWVNLSPFAAHTKRPIVTEFGNSFVAQRQTGTQPEALFDANRSPTFEWFFQIKCCLRTLLY